MVPPARSARQGAWATIAGALAAAEVLGMQCLYHESPLAEILAEVQRALDGAAFLLNFFLQQSDGVDQLLGTRWASGHIDIDRNNLIYALYQGIVIEDAAGGCTRTHGDDPFGFGHLFPELANHGSHFVGDAPRDDDQVGLTRRRAEDLGAETGNVEP